MKNKILGLFMAFMAMFMMSSCVERVVAGYEVRKELTM